MTGMEIAAVSGIGLELINSIFNSGNSGTVQRQLEYYDAVMRQLYQPNYLPESISLISDPATRAQETVAFRNNPLVRDAQNNLGMKNNLFNQINANMPANPFAAPTNTGFQGMGGFNPMGNSTAGSSYMPPQGGTGIQGYGAQAPQMSGVGSLAASPAQSMPPQTQPAPGGLEGIAAPGTGSAPNQYASTPVPTLAEMLSLSNITGGVPAPTPTPAQQSLSTMPSNVTPPAPAPGGRSAQTSEPDPAGYGYTWPGTTPAPTPNPFTYSYAGGVPDPVPEPAPEPTLETIASAVKPGEDVGGVGSGDQPGGVPAPVPPTPPIPPDTIPVQPPADYGGSPDQDGSGGNPDDILKQDVTGVNPDAITLGGGGLGNGQDPNPQNNNLPPYVDPLTQVYQPPPPGSNVGQQTGQTQQTGQVAPPNFMGQQDPRLNRGLQDLALRGLNVPDLEQYRRQMAEQTMGDINSNAAAMGAFGSSGVNQRGLAEGLGRLNMDFVNAQQGLQTNALNNAMMASQGVYGQDAGTYGMNSQNFFNNLTASEAMRSQRLGEQMLPFNAGMQYAGLGSMSGPSQGLAALAGIQAPQGSNTGALSQFGLNYLANRSKSPGAGTLSNAVGSMIG